MSDLDDGVAALRGLAHAVRNYRYDGDDEGAVAAALRKADEVCARFVFTTGVAEAGETMLDWKRDPAKPDRYDSLREVLTRAFDQAASGKGAQRHGQDLPFEAQPMQTISRLVGSHDGLLYQAIKKTQESQRMDKDAAVRELLGAINYLAGAVIYLEKRHG